MVSVIHFQWLQLIGSVPERWKFIIKENYENAANFIIHDHQRLQSYNFR